MNRSLFAHALLVHALFASTSCAGRAVDSRDVPAAPRLTTSPLDAGTSAPQPAEPGPEPEPDPFPVLHDERIGPFAVGMPKEDVLRLAPALRQLGPVIEEGATGEWVEHWVDPVAGLSVGLSATEEHGPRRLRSVDVTAPSRLVTRRNVGIGASYDGVRAEYEEVLDRDFPPTPTTIIAGSLYGGLIFHFEGGLVKSIFLGAGAE